MKVTIEEKPLEKLENEIVEYIINTPNNANPNVVRSMVSAAAENVSMGSDGKIVPYIVEGDYNDAKLFYISSGSPQMEEVALTCLNGKARFLKEISGTSGDKGFLLGGKAYQVYTLSGFAISSSDLFYIRGNAASKGINLMLTGQGIGDKAAEVFSNYFANL